VSFTSRIQNDPSLKVAPLYGTMLRTALLKKATTGQKRKSPTLRGDNKENSRCAPIISFEFLDGVTREALFRQRRILQALQEQNEQEQNQGEATESVKKRREQVQQNMAKLKGIHSTLHTALITVTLLMR